MLPVVLAAQISGDTMMTARGNPIITHQYTADPAALVYKEKVYLYTEHDVAHLKKLL